MKRWCCHGFAVVVAALALLGGPRAALAACTSPAGVGGTITWNESDSVIWCDGTSWYRLKDAASGGVAAGSTGQIQFNNGSNAFAADAALTWDNTNKRLGIGTATTVPGTTVTIAAKNAAQGGIRLTSTSPSAFVDIGPSKLATDNDYSFETVGAVRMTIKGSGPYLGNVGIGTTAPGSQMEMKSSNPMLSFNTTGTYAGVRFQANGVDRYTTALNASLGSQLFSRFDSSGVYQNDPLNMDATGNVSMGGTQMNGSSAGAALYAGANGNVGIGTASPSYLLSLGGNAARTIGMERTTTGTTGYGLTLLAGGAKAATADLSGGDLVLSAGTATGTGSSKISFQTATAQGSTASTDNAPTTKMTILGNGNVGIGTASPSYKLSVQDSSGVNGTGIAEFRGGASSNALQIMTKSSGGNTGAILFAPSSGPLFLNGQLNVISGGNDNVGTLLVGQNTITQLGIGNTGGTASSGFGISSDNGSGGGFLAFSTAGSEKARLTASGNLGIGTAAPTSALTVAKTVTGMAANSDMLGIESTLTNDNASNMRYVVGVNGYTKHNSATTATYAIGTQGHVDLTNAGGTIADAYGVYGLARTAANGTITKAYGVAGRVTINSATSTIGTAYGVFAAVTGTAAARITNGYGLYIDAFDTATINPWALYSATTAPSYLAGSLRVGRTTDSGSSSPAALTIQHTYGVNYGLVLVSDNVGASSVIRFDNPNGNVGAIITTGSGTSYGTTSDRRLKENISDTEGALDKVLRIPVHDFSFKADPAHTLQTGFIAQELKQVFPEAVMTNGDDGEAALPDGATAWNVDYGRVTPLLVKAVQELKAANDNLVEANEALKAANDDLRATVEAQGRDIEALKAASPR